MHTAEYMAAQNTLRAGLTLVRKNMGLYALVVIISALHTVFSDWLDPDAWSLACC